MVYILGTLAKSYKRNSRWFWVAAIFLPVAVIAAGLVFAENLFWDGWLWKYYWGPVVADARETTYGGGEIHQGYTILSEVTYGIILTVAAFGLYRLFHRLDVKIDGGFILALLPYMVLGGTARALEDAALYTEPAVYLFIAPIIYFVLSGVLLLVFLYGLALERWKASSAVRLALQAKPYIILNVVYLALYFSNTGFNYMLHPAVPLALSFGLVTFLFWHGRSRKISASMQCGAFGVLLLALSSWAIALWTGVGEWNAAYTALTGLGLPATRPEAVGYVAALALAFTGASLAVANAFKYRWGWFSRVLSPTSAFIILGQLVDGAATYIGVDMFGYAEKHPVPAFLFEAFGTSLVFLPLKLAVAFVVIYILEVALLEEAKRHPSLIGLVKVFVIVLGLAPGTRDLLRMAMGV